MAVFFFFINFVPQGSTESQQKAFITQCWIDAALHAQYVGSVKTKQKSPEGSRDFSS